jgi:uncharacterized phage protein gp47/JayE
MSYTRPTLTELIERAAASIDTALGTSVARLRRSNLNVFARVIAAVAHGLYGFIAWVARQILPDTADEEILERHAAIWLKTPRIPAAYASGSITVTGSAGAVVQAGAVFSRADGQRYAVDAEVTLTATTATVAITALEAGAAGNADAGTTLTLESPIDSVQSAAIVVSASGGADKESVETLRARVLSRIRQTPMAGAKYDYVTWALEVAGVTRAWSYPHELGAGMVTVRFMRDNDADSFPDASEVADVQAYIDDLAPVTAIIVVVAPIRDAIVYSIELDPDRTSIREAVEAQLRDLHLREAVPGGTILHTHITEAISLAAGENDHLLHAPAGNIVSATGHMATFGGIDWIAS